MDIKVLIIEDEPIARENLIGMIKRQFPQLDIIGECGSVKDSVDFLKTHDPAPQLIFMDVELSDGNSFAIFDQIDVTAQVIMTTAYSEYAIKAFEAEALDYLLKPIEPEALNRAVGRAQERIQHNDAPAIQQHAPVFRERFLIRLNDQIVPVEVKEIAYFYSEAKNSYLVTFNGKSYVLDDSLDTLEQRIDEREFFRISRSCIINQRAIERMGKLLGGRYRITLKKGIDAYTDLTVSRARADAFINWMER